MTKALKRMMRKVRKDDRFMWQAGSALIVGSVVLAGIAYLAPKKEEAPVVVKPITAQPSRVNAFGGVRLEGKAAIVYDLKTGEVLYERNAEAQLPLASITKLLTILAASDALTDTAPVTITESALAQEGESGFALGETFAFGDIARLALVSSSNDATAAIAEAASQKKGVAGTQLLASAAAGAQLTQTYANNGTGLDESTEVSGGYGSAHDVALLAGALLKKAPHLAGATIDPSITISSAQGLPHHLNNTNQEVVRVPGVRLSKTGFTDLAGGNLVVVFDVGFDHPVAAVVLGSSVEGRFRDVRTLIDATHAHFAGLSPS